MKIAFPVFISGSISAGTGYAASVMSGPINLTTTLIPPTPTTNNIESGSVQCFPPFNSALVWYYDSKTNGPHTCWKLDAGTEWSMLKTYRSGGIEGVHWKYTEDVNDRECLENWIYYGPDGQKRLADIAGRTTTVNNSRRWCALPVYRPGGVMGFQWQYCQCQYYPGLPPRAAPIENN